MPIEGFDYKGFAEDLAKQAAEILSGQNNAAPATLTDAEKKVIVDTVNKFCFMSGQALANDTQLKFNAEQASLVTQFIGEWTFHKSIDLINGKIPPQNREAILQIIAANIFNTAKLAIIKNMQQDMLINLVEEKVKHVYSDELGKLLKRGVLSQKQYEKAVNSSNLNDMVQKTEDESNLVNVQKEGNTQGQSDKKVLKFAALAIVLKRMPEEKANIILNSLDKDDIPHVVNYMKMSNIENKIDHQVIIKTLEEIKKLIQPSDKINTERLLKKYYKLINSKGPEVISNLALKERENVKDFILDNTFPALDVFSPRVLQSIVTTIEKKINDN